LVANISWVYSVHNITMNITWIYFCRSLNFQHI
jgi:hypothetical protein